MAQLTGSKRKVAKLFQNGGSQAVRLPAEFRFDADEVYVFRDEATGNIVLSTRPRTNGLADFLAYCAEHPILDEEWEVFDEALRERRRTELPIDDTEIRRLFELDE
ncbi:MAG: AbrB/MazE/SpoVT family DNA-binding domain-containing protein [Chloroflexia bacterium]|nr:AbrB/MazE/SpoVT family DNA-binding domain-containing protein [Chloroflexia bacterium]